jgi:hypothetical protein
MQAGIYKPKDIFFKKDGGTIFCLEQIYTDYSLGEHYDAMNRTRTDNRIPTASYISGTVAVAAITPAGKLGKISFLYKKQSSITPEGPYVSGELVYQDPGLYFLFNDNDKNENMYGPDGITPANNTSKLSGFLALFKNDEGIAKKNIAKEFNIVPHSILKTGKNSYVFIEATNNQIRLANLTLE